MMTYFKKAIIAIADGLGDRPHPLLEGLTPLQKAHTPHLDQVAARGISGMMDLIAPGIPVGTDMGHLILFGGAVADYPGRGPIEAAGIGMDVQSGDIVFRCNLATVDEQWLVVDRRAGRINENTAELLAAIDGLPLNDEVTAYIRPATEHRAVLVLRGRDLSEQVSDTDPKLPGGGQPYLPAEAKDDSEQARRTAALLNRFLTMSHKILDAHPVNARRRQQGLLPANFILTRGAGQYREIGALSKTRGFRGCCIAGESTVLGVAKLAGFSTRTDPTFTANIATNFRLKAEMAIESLQTNDLVFVHVKATDLAGHDNLPLEKVKAIECFDEMVGLILRELPEHTYLALAADHSTPCAVQEHSGEPVPIAICGSDIRWDHVIRFDEIECSRGGLQRISGTDFIHSLLDFTGYAEKQGS